MPDTPNDCTLADGTPCEVKAGTTFHIEDEGGSEDQAAAPPHQTLTAPPPALPRPSPSQLPERKIMEPTTPDVVPAPATPDVHLVAPNGAGDVAAGAPTAATSEQLEVPASPSAGELGDLISQSGGGAIGLAAALIAVVGGTAGFKLWTKISEQKHEQSMKKLEIEQANAGLQGAQPPPCQAANQAVLGELKVINGRLGEHDARLAKAEKASAGFDPSVDVGDLEDRVEALEKSFRKKARTSGGE